MGSKGSFLRPMVLCSTSGMELFLHHWLEKYGAKYELEVNFYRARSDQPSTSKFGIGNSAASPSIKRPSSMRSTR